MFHIIYIVTMPWVSTYSVQLRIYAPCCMAKCFHPNTT